jgi:hypothetical protein
MHPMTVYIQALHHPQTTRARLEADGWTLAPADEGGLLACHPGLPDEGALRKRLNALGLLTSSGVRMEFRPVGRGAALRV